MKQIDLNFKFAIPENWTASQAAIAKLKELSNGVFKIDDRNNEPIGFIEFKKGKLRKAHIWFVKYIELKTKEIGLAELLSLKVEK